jgi:hypothetical protein
MAKESKKASEEPGVETADERQRREKRLASFYKSPEREPTTSTPRPEEHKPPSLTEVNAVFKSEFNTIGYLAIGFSLIALLLIAIFFFRPPKPEAELQALAEAQIQTRDTLEKLAGQITAVDRRVDKTDQSGLVRSLRMTHLALDELKGRGSPGIRAEAEGLQSQIDELLSELKDGSKPGTSP